MKIFWLLSFYTLTRCVASPGSLGNEVTIDLAGSNSSKVSVFDSLEDGLPFKTFTSKDEVSIVGIVDGKESVWKAARGKKCVAAVAYYRGNSIILAIDIKDAEMVFYEKDDGPSWTPITEETFGEKLDKMKRGESTTTAEVCQGNATSEAQAEGVQEEERKTKIPAILDISKTNNKHITAEDSSNERAICTSFQVEDGFEITKIVDGNKTLWVGDADNACQSLDLCLSKGKKFVDMTVKGNEHKYYSQSDEEWTEIAEEEYRQKFGGAQKDKTLNGGKFASYAGDSVTRNPDATFDKLKGSSCNISNPEKSKVYVISNSVKGTTQKSFYPNAGVTITSVADSGNFLWIAEDSDEKLGSVTMYSLDDTAVLTVTIKKGTKQLFKYFENTGNGWTGISGREHMSKLDQLFDPSNQDYRPVSETRVAQETVKKTAKPVVKSGRVSLLAIGQAILGTSEKQYLGFTTPIELNLANLSDKIELHEIKENGTTYTFYLPKNGCYFTKLVDGNKRISIGQDRKCILAYISQEQKQVLLLHNIGLYGEETFKFMVKDGEWKEPEKTLRKRLEGERETMVTDIIQKMFGDD
ncbi:hypothetical protein BEWA_027660 [Theileria equi strain WA]|uniref:Signal peptide containing protein n=1 Tax=Theileria equi strain WA TaxID=1537102 RepID=L0AWG3_THEEQ|nr:hypothetical protein BEWA_027660 [Theileria equi strain WA]AFZ79917.1 hypothetical protein BEWA_027660 [Theileria equi strain WA]|eukprot:XP_004829583.1 hypothetical protein BEWA_027660 [Theileria equi strain WA]